MVRGKPKTSLNVEFVKMPKQNDVNNPFIFLLVEKLEQKLKMLDENVVMC